MNWILLLACLSADFVSNAYARSARRLEGEEIIGGNNADEGQFPYQISLETFGMSVCGGSILNERFVITAAHCVIGEDGCFNELPLKVVGGVNDLQSSCNDNRVAVDVIGVYVPKEFNITDRQSRSTGDIAILKLNKDLDIATNKNLGRVKLPKKNKTYAGVKATVSGFGWNKIYLETDPVFNITRESYGEGDDKMRYARANVIANVDCHYRRPINEKHICATIVQRDFKSPEGVCSGDSGGPLVYEGTQIGVLSTSPIGCREDFKPAIYTRVSEYVDFIDKVVSGIIDTDIRHHTLRPYPY